MIPLGCSESVVIPWWRGWVGVSFSEEEFVSVVTNISEVVDGERKDH